METNMKALSDNHRSNLEKAISKLVQARIEARVDYRTQGEKLLTLRNQLWQKLDIWKRLANEEGTP